MAQEIEALTVQYGIQDLVQVDFNGQYVRITLNGALLFDSGSAELASEAMPLVEKIAKIVDVYNDSVVEIEGHTDNVPIHSAKYESNDVLSMYRALYVADYIREISTIDPANIISSGRGSYVPIADNGTAEGRARNRRVEVKIYNSFNSQEVTGGATDMAAAGAVSESVDSGTGADAGTDAVEAGTDAGTEAATEAGTDTGTDTTTGTGTEAATEAGTNVGAGSTTETVEQ